MTEYQPVPVSAAANIASEFSKKIVIIISLDAVHNRFHTTTFGRLAEEKISAASIGDFLHAELAKAMGIDGIRTRTFEDFRLLDVANLKYENDCLRAELAASRSTPPLTNLEGK